MSGSPVQAAAVANKAAKIFLAHNADTFRREAESSLKFIETRLLESEAKLVDAREALTRFKDKASVFAINDEYRGYEPGPGITDYLLRDAPLSEVMINPGIDRLVVIPAGLPAESSSELLSSPRMVELVRELKERYPSRLVLFDVPPLLTSDDGLAFVPHVDAALLVVAEGQTSYEDVERAKDMLASTHLLGAVMNRASSHIK